MTIRAWHVVLPLTVIVWLVSTWGMALVVFLLAWWASYVFFGGLAARDHHPRCQEPAQRLRGNHR